MLKVCQSEMCSSISGDYRSICMVWYGAYVPYVHMSFLDFPQLHLLLDNCSRRQPEGVVSDCLSEVIRTQKNTIGLVFFLIWLVLPRGSQPFPYHGPLCSIENSYGPQVTTNSQLSKVVCVYGWLYWKEYRICIYPETKSMKFSQSVDTGVCLQALHIVVPLEMKHTWCRELLQGRSSI